MQHNQPWLGRYFYIRHKTDQRCKSLINTNKETWFQGKFSGDRFSKQSKGPKGLNIAKFESSCWSFANYISQQIFLLRALDWFLFLSPFPRFVEPLLHRMYVMELWTSGAAGSIACTLCPSGSYNSSFGDCCKHKFLYLITLNSQIFVNILYCSYSDTHYQWSTAKLPWFNSTVFTYKPISWKSFVKSM